MYCLARNLFFRSALSCARASAPDAQLNVVQQYSKSTENGYSGVTKMFHAHYKDVASFCKRLACLVVYVQSTRHVAAAVHEHERR
jgi:hypothetical protein